MKKVMNGGAVNMIKRRRIWNEKQKSEFLIRIGELLQQGYSLSHAIELYSLNDNKEAEKIVLPFLNQLKEGRSFYEVLDFYSFPNDILGYLYFSEKHDLSQALIQSGSMLKRRQKLKETLNKVLRYPLFLSWVMIIMIIIVFRYLFPQFQTLYHSLNVDLPLITTLLLQVIHILPWFLLTIGTVLFFSIIYYMLWLRRKTPHEKLRIFLRFPIIRSLLILFFTHLFSSHLSSLLKGGLSIHEAVLVFEKQDHLLFFQDEGKELKLLLQQGEPLEKAILTRPFYLKELSSVINHGHANGKLADELMLYSEMVLRKLEDRLQRYLMMLQPILFMCIGSVILLLFLSILLPMFHVIQSV
jgi:competence protein ComGB